MLPSQLPEFQQCIDHERPFVLLNETANGHPTTVDPHKRHHLRYRYTDTGEIVLVPNMDYNRTPQMRAEQLRWQAADREEKAARLKRSTPADWQPWMAEQVAERYLLNAHRIRQVADRIEAGTAPWDTPWGLETEQLWWPAEERAKSHPKAWSIGAYIAGAAELTQAPLKPMQMQQLRADAEHVAITAERKGLKLDKDELRDAAYTALHHFDLGCWLHLYSKRVDRPVTPASTLDRIDCVRRLFEAGITHPGNRFATVFDFGARQFEACLSMPDAQAVIAALRDLAHGSPRSELAGSVRSMKWLWPKSSIVMTEGLPIDRQEDAVSRLGRQPVPVSIHVMQPGDDGLRRMRAAPSAPGDLDASKVDEPADEAFDGDARATVPRERG